MYGSANTPPPNRLGLETTRVGLNVCLRVCVCSRVLVMGSYSAFAVLGSAVVDGVNAAAAITVVGINVIAGGVSGAVTVFAVVAAALGFATTETHSQLSLTSWWSLNGQLVRASICGMCKHSYFAPFGASRRNLRQ